MSQGHSWHALIAWPYVDIFLSHSEGLAWRIKGPAFNIWSLISLFATFWLSCCRPSAAGFGPCILAKKKSPHCMSFFCSFGVLILLVTHHLVCKSLLWKYKERLFIFQRGLTFAKVKNAYLQLITWMMPTWRRYTHCKISGGVRGTQDFGVNPMTIHGFGISKIKRNILSLLHNDTMCSCHINFFYSIEQFTKNITRWELVVVP